MADSNTRRNGRNGCSPEKTHRDDKAPTGSVSFIPTQSDDLALMSTQATQHDPLKLAARDCLTFVKMLPLFFDIFLPFRTNEKTDEFYCWGANLFGLAVLSFVSVLQLVLLALAIPAFIVLPGAAIAFILFGGTALIRILCWPIQGPAEATSAPPTDPATIAQHAQYSSERWFFLNGCCVTGHALHCNIDLLSDTFGRPVQAVHNKTYGILGDLVECILQRAFGFYSAETWQSYGFIKAYCMDPEVTKVVMIGHSQGGIMASQILDELYMDLPSDAVSKLEVYTFGNAAAHFNNPLRKMIESDSEFTTDTRPTPRSLIGPTASPTSTISPIAPLTTLSNQSAQSSTPPPPTPIRGTTRASTISPLLPKRVIPHIEHYCNSEDMVTRWGSLYSATAILDNRFCGHIFINEGASGHMLNQHYLARMFPKSEAQTILGSGELPFLERTVNVDTATVARRDRRGIKQMTLMRQNSIPLEAMLSPTTPRSAQAIYKDLKLGDGKELEWKYLAGAQGSRISVAVPQAVEHSEMEGEEERHECHGKKVKEISRLWRYMGGGDPDRDL